MAARGIIVDDVCVVKVGSSCPQVVWYVLMVILESDTRHCQMSARSPLGPPRIFQIVSLVVLYLDLR